MVMGLPESNGSVISFEEALEFLRKKFPNVHKRMLEKRLRQTEVHEKEKIENIGAIGVLFNSDEGIACIFSRTRYDAESIMEKALKLDMDGRFTHGHCYMENRTIAIKKTTFNTEKQHIWERV